MSEKQQSINNLLAAKIKETEKVIAQNLSSLMYADDYKPEKQTFWRRTKNMLRTVKNRVSNAWDALRGRLDYDY